MGDSAVSVVWLDLAPAVPEGDLRHVGLSDEERARVARLATEELRRRATVRFARRREALAELLGVTGRDVVLTHDELGRPRARGPSGADILTSSSSSRGLGLLVVSPSLRVGADVEATSEFVDTPGFVDRVATSRERRALGDLAPGERRHALARLWTRKEAYLKATGEGIGAGLSHVEVPLGRGLWGARFKPVPGGSEWLLCDLEPPLDGYAAALVIELDATGLPEIVVSRP